VVISVFFSVLGLSLGARLIIDFVSVRDGLIIAPTYVCHVRDHGVVHFGTYPFRYQSDLDVTFGTTTISTSVPFWTTSVPKIPSRNIDSMPEHDKINVMPRRYVLMSAQLTTAVRKYTGV